MWSETGDALRVLLPLLQSTVNNLARSDPALALTGTFARGDIATVRRHLQALSRNGLRGSARGLQTTRCPLTRIGSSQWVGTETREANKTNPNRGDKEVTADELALCAVASVRVSANKTSKSA